VAEIVVYQDELGNTTIHRPDCGNVARIPTAYSADGRRKTTFTSVDLARKKCPETSVCGCLQGAKGRYCQ
jgi:hypothetical protein